MMRNVVLPPISFVGGLEDSYSFTMALGLSTFFAGLSIRLYPQKEGAADNGLGLTLIPLTLGRISRFPARVLSILALSSLAGGLAVSTILP